MAWFVGEDGAWAHEWRAVLAEVRSQTDQATGLARAARTDSWQATAATRYRDELDLLEQELRRLTEAVLGADQTLARHAESAVAQRAAMVPEGLDPTSAGAGWLVLGVGLADQLGSR
ncbi:hypothetical protein J4G33_04470 [Actinotalea sp. BY-33]|uniref:Uncharacterized protein n=1 Tax=Actinotalea soli TaxID=2819234 RepID=A0A939LTI3_9CELL|nr:hypothetical protein [Actinotalea soli]MBO1751052.1 hypothetical protein [Actinotalea soli]